MNLYEETCDIIKKYKRGIQEVLWVGSRDGNYIMSFSDFKKIASEIDYDNGYGVAQIALDLVVVAACWWLERREYDGAEWWEFATVPLMSAKPIENFIFMHRVRDTGTIESINNHKED